MTAGGPQFRATPQNPDLLRWGVGIQVLLLVIAWLIGLVVRRLLASRMTMSTASATLTGLGGLWGGLLVAGWIFSSSDMWRPAMIGVAAAVAAVVVIIVSLIVAYLHPRPGLEPIAEVAKRGESDSLEFKSSARWNMRAGKRDDAMETSLPRRSRVMNSGGGTLLIGVDDDGRLIGLGPDYATLKTPDADRFELWIRDLWGQRLGTNAAALPLLDFAEASDPQEGYGPQEVCRVTIPPSTRPVYLKGPKGKGEAELWVRVGNSTRRLEVADAVQYVAARWPESVRVSPLSRIRLFLAMSRHRDTPTRLPRVVERVLTERAKHGVGSSEGE